MSKHCPEKYKQLHEEYEKAKYDKYVSDIENTSYQFSEFHGLMVTVYPEPKPLGFKFRVHNGAWEGYMNHEGIWIGENEFVEGPNDWVEMLWGEMTPDFREAWYVPIREGVMSFEKWQEQEIWASSLDDGISF